MYEVPLEYLAHLVTVPVTVNGVETTFVVDSGIGFTILRDTLPGCVPTGETFTGKRMSGQDVTVPLATAPSLVFGGEERRDVQVGLLDMSGFPDALEHVGGFLSLAFFAETVLTVDYPRGRVVVGGPADGVEVPCRAEWDGPALSLHMPLVLPDGRVAEVEVDMGSDALILDDRFRELGSAEERRVDGTDETGHAYTRRFTTLPGRVHVPGVPELGQDDPEVMFQSIIYDGLVGQQFLRRFVVSFDVAASRLVLG
ncbi:MAG TPA: retropepsin-like aspartic protease [Gaiellaceae bacterium]|nr:retropepsin-like aspartic protease [Gaiellaceae bacterium]